VGEKLRVLKILSSAEIMDSTNERKRTRENERKKRRKEGNHIRKNEGTDRNREKASREIRKLIKMEGKIKQSKMKIENK
jgi:hypothetical protein